MGVSSSGGGPQIDPLKNHLSHCSLSLYIYIYIYTYIPFPAPPPKQNQTHPSSRFVLISASPFQPTHVVGAATDLSTQSGRLTPSWDATCQHIYNTCDCECKWMYTIIWYESFDQALRLFVFVTVSANGCTPSIWYESFDQPLRILKCSCVRQGKPTVPLFFCDCECKWMYTNIWAVALPS